MESIFEEMGGIYRQEGDYLIPNLVLPDTSEYHIGKYGRIRRSYLKEHHPILYNNYLLEGTLFKHLAENRSSLQQAYGNHCCCYGKAGGRDRSTQSVRPNGMGVPYQFHPQPCGRNYLD